MRELSYQKMGESHSIIHTDKLEKSRDNLTGMKQLNQYVIVGDLGKYKI